MIYMDRFLGIIIEQLLIPYSLTRLQDFDRVQILNGPQLINETSSDLLRIMLYPFLLCTYQFSVFCA